jgi:hypothetical protein
MTEAEEALDFSQFGPFIANETPLLTKPVMLMASSQDGQRVAMSKLVVKGAKDSVFVYVYSIDEKDRSFAQDGAPLEFSTQDPPTSISFDLSGNYLVLGFPNGPPADYSGTVKIATLLSDEWTVITTIKPPVGNAHAGLSCRLATDLSIPLLAIGGSVVKNSSTVTAGPSIITASPGGENENLFPDISEQTVAILQNYPAPIITSNDPNQNAFFNSMNAYFATIADDASIAAFTSPEAGRVFMFTPQTFAQFRGDLQNYSGYFVLPSGIDFATVGPCALSSEGSMLIIGTIPTTSSPPASASDARLFIFTNVLRALRSGFLAGIPADLSIGAPLRARAVTSITISKDRSRFSVSFGDIGAVGVYTFSQSGPTVLSLISSLGPNIHQLSGFKGVYNPFKASFPCVAFTKEDGSELLVSSPSGGQNQKMGAGGVYRFSIKTVPGPGEITELILKTMFAVFIVMISLLIIGISIWAIAKSSQVI